MHIFFCFSISIKFKNTLHLSKHLKILNSPNEEMNATVHCMQLHSKKIDFVRKKFRSSFAIQKSLANEIYWYLLILTPIPNIYCRVHFILNYDHLVPDIASFIRFINTCHFILFWKENVHQLSKNITNCWICLNCLIFAKNQNISYWLTEDFDKT